MALDRHRPSLLEVLGKLCKCKKKKVFRIFVFGMSLCVMLKKDFTIILKKMRNVNAVSVEKVFWVFMPS